MPRVAQLVASLVAVLAVGACGSDAAGTPPVPTFDVANIPALQPGPGGSGDVDAIVADIMAGIEANEDAPAGALAAPLPPSLESAAGGALQIPALSRDNPLVDAVCTLAGIPGSDIAIEEVVNQVLEHAGSIHRLEGLGLVVAAADVGCEALVPSLNARLQVKLPSSLALTGLVPTAAPLADLLPTTATPALGETVRVAEGTRPVLDVTVNDVRCAPAPASDPLAALHRLVAADVTIAGLADGEEYDAFYWTIAADDVVGTPTFSADVDWSPPLVYGVLTNGTSVRGWLIASVPTPTRSITVTYRGNPYTTTPVLRVDRGVCSE
ncbi:MAG TPA: hypothetical protein VGM49_08955 [Candidatus Limnocylindrales bacterium]